MEKIMFAIFRWFDRHTDRSIDFVGYWRRRIFGPDKKKMAEIEAMRVYTKKDE